MEFLVDPMHVEDRQDLGIEVTDDLDAESPTEKRGGFEHNIVAGHPAFAGLGNLPPRCKGALVVGVIVVRQSDESRRVDEDSHYW
jgi:hypothetical protein